MPSSLEPPFTAQLQLRLAGLSRNAGGDPVVPDDPVAPDAPDNPETPERRDARYALAPVAPSSSARARGPEPPLAPAPPDLRSRTRPLRSRPLCQRENPDAPARSLPPLRRPCRLSSPIAAGHAARAPRCLLLPGPGARRQPPPRPPPPAAAPPPPARRELPRDKLEVTDHDLDRLFRRSVDLEARKVHAEGQCLLRDVRRRVLWRVRPALDQPVVPSTGCNPPAAARDADVRPVKARRRQRPAAERDVYESSPIVSPRPDSPSSRRRAVRLAPARVLDVDLVRAVAADARRRAVGKQASTTFLSYVSIGPSTCHWYVPKPSLSVVNISDAVQEPPLSEILRWR